MPVEITFRAAAVTPPIVLLPDVLSISTPTPDAGCCDGTSARSPVASVPMRLPSTRLSDAPALAMSTPTPPWTDAVKVE